MHREPLLALLGRHVPGDPSEAVSLERMIDFVRSEPRCFLRESLEAHVTASALVLDRRHERALLTWHRKSNRWIYLGGHCDGDPDVLGVARRELVEESGLEHSRLLLEAPFYVDVDRVARHGDVPPHDHHDVLFLFEADGRAPLVVSDESHALDWVPFEDPRFLSEPVLVRLAAKLSRNGLVGGV